MNARFHGIPFWLWALALTVGMGIGATAFALLGPRRALWVAALIALLLIGLLNELRIRQHRR